MDVHCSEWEEDKKTGKPNHVAFATVDWNRVENIQRELDRIQRCTHCGVLSGRTKLWVANGKSFHFCGEDCHKLFSDFLERERLFV